MLANTNKNKMERHLNMSIIEGRACAPANVIRDEDPPIAYLRLAVHNDYMSKRDNQLIERVQYISVIARGKLAAIAANVQKDQLVSVKGSLIQQEEEFTDRKSGKLIMRDRVAIDAELIRMYGPYDGSVQKQRIEGTGGGLSIGAEEEIGDEVNGNVRT